MPRYLFIGQYTAEGAKGVIKDGGSKRRQVANQVMESLGGRVESYYFGFGSDDFYVIADLPDHAAASAASLTVGASGTISLRTIVLLTPEEIDEAAKRSVQFSPPGA
jgi:uncharacterized protein with GYD domain